MWERIRFARYALRFERAFKTDDWGPVKECFHPDSRYIVEGSASEWDGEVRGPDAIAAFMKRMLDTIDRKFKKRIPKLAAWPRVKGGELILRWGAIYVAEAGETVLHGESRCRFSDGKILELRDIMDAEECRKWAALVGVAPNAG